MWCVEKRKFRECVIWCRGRERTELALIGKIEALMISGMALNDIRNGS